MGLFKPKWMTINPNKADKAIQEIAQISDENLLDQIALEAPLLHVATAAIERITDQQRLKRMAFRCPLGSTQTRNVIIRHITDQQVLVQVLSEINSFDSFLRDSVKRITNLQILQNMALKNHASGYTALEYIDDPCFLKRIALECDDGRSEIAVKRIADQETLAEIIQKTVHEKSKAMAAEKITDSHIAKELFAATNVPYNVKATLIPMIEDAQLLYKYSQYPYSRSQNELKAKEKLEQIWSEKKKLLKVETKKQYDELRAQRQDHIGEVITIVCPTCGSPVSWHCDYESIDSYKMENTMVCEKGHVYSDPAELSAQYAIRLAWMKPKKRQDKTTRICPLCGGDEYKCKCTSSEKYAYPPVELPLVMFSAKLM